MYTQTLSRPLGAPMPFHSRSLIKATPQISIPTARPQAKGLTRAQLREIIIEQLG